jgi:hypothetical protein
MCAATQLTVAVITQAATSCAIITRNCIKASFSYSLPVTDTALYAVFVPLCICVCTVQSIAIVYTSSLCHAQALA